MLKAIREGKLGMGLEDAKYVWRPFAPDTFKSACMYLMAHKEPFERIDSTGNEDDSWTTLEFNDVDGGLSRAFDTGPQEEQAKVMCPQD